MFYPTLHLTVHSLQSCTELAAAGECYEERCGNVTRPVLSKQCTTVMEEQCTVTLDQVTHTHTVHTAALNRYVCVFIVIVTQINSIG